MRFDGSVKKRKRGAALMVDGTKEVRRRSQAAFVETSAYVRLRRDLPLSNYGMASETARQGRMKEDARRARK